MKRFRIISVFLVICLLLCSCGTDEANPPKTEATLPPPEAAEPETVTMLIYSDRMGVTFQALMEHISETVNDVLSKKGYAAVRLQIVAGSQNEVRDTGKPGAPYADAILEYDLFYENTALSTQYSQFENLAASGMAADITDLMAEHEGLYNAYSPDFWREVTIDGRIFAVPASSVGQSEGTYESGILIRSDIVEALDAKMPETIDELLELSNLARKEGMDFQLAFDAIYPPWAFHRTYDEWPFFVDYESLFVMYPDGTLESYPHSDIFRKDAENLSKFYNGRPLGTAGDIANAQASWDFLAALPSVKYNANTPNAEFIELIQFAPEKPSFNMRTYCEARIYVSNKSEKKDAAITLLEAIYTNQEIYDAFLYGEEGEDWILHEDGTRETLTETGNILAYYGLNRSNHGASDAQSILSIPAREGTVIDFPAAAFRFTPSDPTILQSVQQSYYPSQQNKYAVYQVRINLAGVSSSKTAIDLMLNRLDPSGFNRLLDEAKKQYEDFIR